MSARRIVLLVLCIVPPLIEMGVLVALGQGQVASFSPQLTAVPPFGLLHDMRWLYVYHYSWPSFAWEWLAMMAFRSLLTMVLIRCAWPADQPAPGWGAALGRAAVFDLVAFVILSPLVVLMFATSASGLAWPWYVGMIPLVIFSLLVTPWVITGDWSRWPTGRGIGWIVLAWPLLGVAGGAILLFPLWAGFLITAACGAFNAWTWSSITRSLAAAPHPRTFKLLPVAALAVIYGILFGGLAWTVVPGKPPELAKASAIPPARGKTLLIVQGLDSYWSGQPPPPLVGSGLHEEVFSYRGLDAQGRPLPYPRAATRVPLAESAQKLAEQIDALVRHGAGSIWILADSEGSLATQLYLGARPDAPVQRVVITSPEIAPALVYLPRPGQSGWGVVSGFVLRTWFRYLEVMGWSRNLETVLWSILDHGPVMTQLERCPLGNVRYTMLMPLEASVARPFGMETAMPIYQAGFFHGALTNALNFKPVITKVLSGGLPRHSEWWAVVNWLGRAAGSAWRMPPLARSLPAAWRFDAGTSKLDCNRVQDRIQQVFAGIAARPNRTAAR